MLDFPRWKVWLINLIIALGVLFSIPSLIAGTPYANHWPSWLPQYKINLGLDLAGGSHLLLVADAKDALKKRLASKEEEITAELGRGDNKIDIGDISTANGQLSFMVRDPRQLDAAVEKLRALTLPAGLSGQRDWDVGVVDSTRIVLTPSAAGTQKVLSDAMGVARDVVRRRIDPGGTKEVDVRTEGNNRIVVQVPGDKNPEALKKLIGQTARLEFKMVDQSADPNQVLQGRAPAGSQVLPMAEGGGAIAVKRRVLVDGDQLTSAKQGFDENGRPAIEFKFNVAGARRFARVTQQNIGKPFAIILDDKVLSAPVIQSPILGGSGQITGSFTVESANELAVSLNSGKLPVKLNPIEERTVGPDLGK